MQDLCVQKIFDPMLYLDAHYSHLRDECHLFETILVKLHEFLAQGTMIMGSTVHSDCYIS
jgi:hypothetical protein